MNKVLSHFLPPDVRYKQRLRETKVELKRAGREDLYKIMSVPKDASEAEIKKAYTKGALKGHPDRWSGKTDEEKAGAEKEFKNLNRAFEVLSDPTKKQR